MHNIHALKSQEVPFMSVESLLKLLTKMGIENFLIGLAETIKQDFGRWNEFEKSPRFASHSKDGVIELMPISDGDNFSFKYVMGTPITLNVAYKLSLLSVFLRMLI